MSAIADLISTPTLIPAIAACAVFAVELIGIAIRFAKGGKFESYLYLIKLAVIRTAGEIMKIVWIQMANPTENFIIVCLVLSKVGSVFVLLCLFRTLEYWIQFRVHPGQPLPPLEQKVLRLSLLVAVVGQILGIVGIIEMFNTDSYNLGVTLRDASRAILLLASVIFLLLVLANASRARDPTNTAILLLLGSIAAIRAAFDVVAIIVPATSIIATSEAFQYIFDSIPEALAIGIAIFYNLARQGAMGAPLNTAYEGAGQYSVPYDGQYQVTYPPYSRKSGV